MWIAKLVGPSSFGRMSPVWLLNTLQRVRSTSYYGRWLAWCHKKLDFISFVNRFVKRDHICHHSKNNDPNFRDLAHAFSPKHGGEVHFQEAETWTINSRQGTNCCPPIFPKCFQSYTFLIAYLEHQGQICCPWLFTKSATHWDCFTPIFNRL